MINKDHHYCTEDIEKNINWYHMVADKYRISNIVLGVLGVNETENLRHMYELALNSETSVQPGVNQKKHTLIAKIHSIIPREVERITQKKKLEIMRRAK